MDQDKNCKKLINAIKQHDFASINKSISEGININYIGKNTASPFMVAVSMLGQNKKNPNYQKIFNYLLKTGGDLKAQDTAHGYTPLMIAASFGNFDLVAAILKKDKSCINVKGNSGETALHIAAYVGNPKIVKLLLKSGANANNKINKKTNEANEESVITLGNSYDKKGMLQNNFDALEIAFGRADIATAITLMESNKSNINNPNLKQLANNSPNKDSLLSFLKMYKSSDNSMSY